MSIEKPINLDDLRAARDSLLRQLSNMSPPQPTSVLHPFQAVDIFLVPKGWFTKLIWRWVRWDMTWGDQVPLNVRKKP